MTDIEIPYEKDRRGHYRFFEILPGFLSWTLLFLPVILSIIDITYAVAFILGYLLIYFVRSFGFDFRAIGGYLTMKKHLKIDWNKLNDDLNRGEASNHNESIPSWHYSNLDRLKSYSTVYKPKQIYHAVIIATVNESIEVLEPTVESVLSTNFDKKKIILIFAYEGRAGKDTKDRVEFLLSKYKNQFFDAFSVEHPANIPGEIIGKGANISTAGKVLHKFIIDKKIPLDHVLVTTLDADNRPNKLYFSALTYTFCVVPEPIKSSFQPLPMFTNNIWDAPTLMRVIATGNNLFYLVLTQRPHLERNFSAHSQSLKALVDMNFWSVRTIVEDGHHFWRSYFFFDGNYRVYPLSIPIYQDAVLAETYKKTLKAQFIQLRRWTYGASDIAYIADKGLFTKNKIPKLDVLSKLFRTLEGHVTWATGTILIFGAAFIPSFLHPRNYSAYELPLIVSRIQQIGLAGLLISVYIIFVTLPPRPSRYKRHRSIIMAIQWILAPISAILYGTIAAFNSQTRLMFKRYLSKFDVTEKAVVTSKGIISSESDPTPLSNKD